MHKYRAPRRPQHRKNTNTTAKWLGISIAVLLVGMVLLAAIA